MTTVPRVMRVAGAFRPANGLPPASIEVVTLTIYAAEVGGDPLWQESHEVRVGSDGQYSILAGSTSADGLPAALLASGDALWLGMRCERPGESDQPRVPLTSVPYALRASDADTLGGLPPSAFLRADPAAREAAGGADPSASPARSQLGPLANSGTPNFIGKFTDTVDLGNSVLFESNGRIGLGTTTPLDQLQTRFTDTSGSLTGIAVQNLGNTASSYSGMLFYDQHGALGQFQGFNNVTHEYRINNIASGGSINFMAGGASRLLVRNDGDIELPGALRKGGNRYLHADGLDNLAVGVNAMATNVTARQNVAVGTSALGAITDGSGSGGNVAVGYRALAANNGYHNVAIGHLSFQNSPGDINIGLGAFTGADQVNGDANMYLGFDVGRTRNEFATIRIGDSGYYSRVFLGGVRDKTTGSNDAVAVVIDAFGQLGTINSSRRYKRDIQDMGEASSGLMKLRPVTYRYEEPYADGSRPIDYGLIAEEVAEIYPDLVAHLATGEVQTVQYHKVNAMLLNELQKQHRQIADQRSELAEMRARLAALERLLASDRQ